MKPIIFSRRPQDLEIDAESAVCVYHKSYTGNLPKIAGCRYIEFRVLCDSFQNINYFDGKDTVVFVGANKFFNPSTRFHPIFDMLQYGLPGLKRYSVDIAPYIGPIWRLWSHFSFSGVPYGDYTYSYLLESHYNSFIDGVRSDNPMSLDNIRRFSRDHVFIDYSRYFAEPKVVLVELPAKVHAEYQRLKTDLFERHDAISKIIYGLSAFAREHCPERRIPQEHRIFEEPEKVQIVRTDLKVDEYLTNKLIDKIREVNRVVEVLRS